MTSLPVTSSNKNIKVIELRNYVMKDGMRNRFADFFNEHFIGSQAELGGYVLGQYKPKGEEENFLWIRGFEDMPARSKFLPAFYSGPVWKQYREEANAMLANNDNVHLLKPLLLKDATIDTTTGINSNTFHYGSGIMVIEYYIANHKLDKLIDLFASKYLSILKNAGNETLTLWISELTENDFPRLPVFQDRNLLVTISFYKDEACFISQKKKADASISTELKTEMQDIITTKNTLILYPVHQ